MKHDSTKIKQLADARGFTVRQKQGRFVLGGPADFGPGTYAEARAFLAGFPTARQRKVRVRGDAEELTQGQIDYRRSRKGYDAPIYEPELGESAPDWLLGLHAITVMLPPGADSDDALRGLFVAENRERRRGAQIIKHRLVDAKTLIAGGGLEAHRVVVSDHDVESARAYGEGLEIVLLAAWMAGPRWRREPGRHGPRGPRASAELMALTM